MASDFKFTPIQPASVFSFTPVDQTPTPTPQAGASPGLSAKGKRYEMRQIRRAFTHPTRQQPGISQYGWAEKPTIEKFFTALDMPLTMAHAAYMAEPGDRTGAALRALEAGSDIPLTNVLGGSKSRVAQYIAKTPPLAGAAGFAEQNINPAYWGIGRVVRGIRGVSQPLLKRAGEAGIAKYPAVKAAADIFAPLHSLSPEEHAAALKLAQETSRAPEEAEAVVVNALRGFSPGDRRTITDIVQGLYPESPMQNQFIAANARITAPELYAKAQEIERMMFQTGVRKGQNVPKGTFIGPVRPRRGYLPGMMPPKEEIPEGQTIPSRVPTGTSYGGRKFSIDPRSVKAKSYGSALMREQAGIPTETDVSRLAHKALVSAARYESFQDFAKTLDRIGAVREAKYVDRQHPELGEMTAQEYSRYARSTARTTARVQYPTMTDLTGQTGLGASQERATRMTEAQITKELTQHLRPGSQEYAGAALRKGRVIQRAAAPIADLRPANLEAHLLQRRQAAQGIARAIMRRQEQVAVPGMESFGQSPHLPEQLRNKIGKDTLVRFTNKMSGYTPEKAVGELGELYDKWTAGVRVGMIANMWYHPLFNEMPQYENASGKMGGSAAAAVLKYRDDLTRFLRQSAVRPVSLREVAGTELGAMIDYARQTGSLAALGGKRDPAAMLRGGARGVATRSWDMNQRVTFGFDDFFSALLANDFKRVGIPDSQIGKRVRDALGRYGPAFEPGINLNRLFYFYPWMSTMANHWLGGRGFENLKPIAAMHGFQQNYNTAAGAQTQNPLEIGQTVLPQSYGFALRAINEPLSLVGWMTGHAVPGLEIPASVALNNVAPFSAASTYPSGEIKRDFRIRTPGAPAGYQALELGRYAAQRAIPGGFQLDNIIQGLKAQGITGAFKAVSGARTYPDYDATYNRQMTILDEALQRKAITWKQYQDYVKMAEDQRKHRLGMKKAVDQSWLSH